jgi:hypothetical protein
MSKTIKTRIKHRIDTLANWLNSTDILLSGEIAIVSTQAEEAYLNPVTGKTEPVADLLIKIGDGTKTFSELPWLSAKAADVYDWAKASELAFDETTKTLKFVGVTNIDGSDKVITFNYVTPAEVSAIIDPIAANVEILSTRLDDQLKLKADKSDTYTKAEINTITDDLTNGINLKLNAKPNDTDYLINENDKINLKYIPDSILGQLVYGGVLYGSGGTSIVGITGFDAVISLSTNAQNKLALSNSHIGINYADEDFALYEGLYFICGMGYTFKFGTIDFQIGD